jgi:predicted PurR-regulated permease PerM
MAGGALLGFLGVLIAVPVAAAIGVLVRFGLERYLDSRMFHGRPVIPREPPVDLGPLP